MHRYLASIFNESQIETAIQDAFKFNYNSCDLYKEYCDSINKNYSDNTRIEDIPFLPISFFKNHKIQSNQKSKSKLFLSSGTTGKKSKHYVTDLNIYNHSLLNLLNMPLETQKSFISLE